MKQLAKLFLSLVLMLSVLVFSQSVNAAGTEPSVAVRFNGASFSATSIYHGGAISCDKYTNDPAICYLRGYFKSTDTSETVTITVTPPAGQRVASWNNALCNNNSNVCSIVFTVIRDENGYVESYTPMLPQLNLTFEPIPTTPAPTATPPATAKPTTTTSTVIDTPKSSLNTVEPVSGFTINGISDESEEITSLENGAPVVLSGTTIPNATIKLYIFSTPREATVQSDENGLWTYTITDLEPGDHRVEAVVTDTATDTASDRIELASFSIKSVAAIREPQENTVKTSISGMNLLVITSAGLMVLFIAAITAIIIKRKRSARPKKPDTETPLTPTNPTASSPDTISQINPIVSAEPEKTSGEDQ